MGNVPAIDPPGRRPRTPSGGIDDSPSLARSLAQRAEVTHGLGKSAGTRGLVRARIRLQGGGGTVVEDDRSREDDWFRKNEEQLLEAARVAREKREAERAAAETADARKSLRERH